MGQMVEILFIYLFIFVPQGLIKLIKNDSNDFDNTLF